MKEFRVPPGYENTNLCCPTCGYMENTPPKEIDHLYPGTVLQDRYVVGTTLGFGRFCVTYKAWDKILKTVVAIKEYYPFGQTRRAPGNSVVEVYPPQKKYEYLKGLNCFLDEARNTARFKKNPNIVAVNDYFEENNTAYRVMEYLQGMTLRGYLSHENGTINYVSAINITMSVIAALRDIHKAGFLHGNITPYNIILCEGGAVKLIGFDALSFSDKHKPLPLSVLLTPGFSPIEQYSEQSKQGPWTDIYALSSTLYMMVTGVVPDDSTNRLMDDTVVSPMVLNPDIPKYLSNTIMKGLAMDPNRRFKNVDEFEQALENKKKVADLKLGIKRRKQKRQYDKG
jgi:serine/threonine protein kinase